jgi:hypothetical protein
MFDYALISILVSVGLFVGMLLLLDWGRRLGQRRQSQEGESGRAGLGTVEGAVLALMGLLVAFTFSGAASRFDSRRDLILQEANAIGTAWLRLDLLPANEQPAVRDLFRRYVDARLDIYRKLPDLKASYNSLAQANSLQGELWTRTLAALQQASPAVTGQLVPSLNEMFDIATSRTMAARTHPPLIIFCMLGGLALMSSLLAGFAMAGGKSRSWVHMFAFALILAVTVYVILDLEFPRFGLIRVDAADRVLYEVREGMK